MIALAACMRELIPIMDMVQLLAVAVRIPAEDVNMRVSVHENNSSLTLARLCGEWQLVSRNYKARGASGGKYEARIAIFHILAAINRFSLISQKAESH